MRVLIVGATARAAAHSALRAGMAPTVADLFGDQDLVACCPSTRIDRCEYPNVFEAFSGQVAPQNWFYTGGIENHPTLVDRISQRHKLIGNPGSVLRQVRDPMLIRDVLERHGLPCPEVRLSLNGHEATGQWLLKPRDSAAGRGIIACDRFTQQHFTKNMYVQKFVDGLSCSAVFLSRSGSVRLMGVTRQLIGKPGSRFAYRGNVGPWPVLAEVERALCRLGEVLVAEFELEGLFGVDFILKDDKVWPVEVNPRYTASVEVLERAGGRSLLAVSEKDANEASEYNHLSMSRHVGKAIIFAPVDLIIPSDWSSGIDLGESWRGDAGLADLPCPGQSFRKGEPVLTVFATAGTFDECWSETLLAERWWLDRLRSWSPIGETRVETI